MPKLSLTEVREALTALEYLNEQAVPLPAALWLGDQTVAIKRAYFPAYEALRIEVVTSFGEAGVLEDQREAFQNAMETQMAETLIELKTERRLFSDLKLARLPTKIIYPLRFLWRQPNARTKN